MSVIVNFFRLTNVFVSSVFFISFMCSAMESSTRVPEEYYERLSPSLKKLVTKNQLDQMVTDLTISSGIKTIAIENLCTLIDDPKGDCMCQLWALVPVLFGSDTRFVEDEFIGLLSVLSSCVDKDRDGKCEANMGGGITGVARSDFSFLQDYFSKQKIVPITASKKKNVQKFS